MDTTAAERFEQVIRDDGRYPAEAYEFLYAGLDFTTKRRYGQKTTRRQRHVSGAELCDGLRALAQERWGLLARTVLRNWNIRHTRDFGEMVFLLVQHEFMGKQDTDQIEDFDDVYDFATLEQYEIPIDELGG